MFSTTGEKAPIFGMIQRTGEVVIRMLESVPQQTIKPLILKTVAAKNLICTDEYAMAQTASQHFARKVATVFELF